MVPGLPFPDIEDVEKIRQRFRIVRAGAASDDDGAILPPIHRIDGNLRQIQHL